MTQPNLPGVGRGDPDYEGPDCSLCEGDGEVAENFGIHSTGTPRIVPCPRCRPVDQFHNCPEGSWCSCL